MTVKTKRQQTYQARLTTRMTAVFVCTQLKAVKRAKMIPSGGVLWYTRKQIKTVIRG